jgi:hypothetical protein
MTGTSAAVTVAATTTASMTKGRAASDNTGSSRSTAAGDTHNNLWTSLLAETSKKAKVLDSSVIILGKNKSAKRQIFDAISKTKEGGRLSGKSSFDFMEDYGYFEVDDTYSDSELGKVNVWSIDNDGLNDAFEIMHVGSDIWKVSFHGIRYFALLTSLLQQTFVIGIDAKASAADIMDTFQHSVQSIARLTKRLATNPEFMSIQRDVVEYLSCVRSGFDSMSEAKAENIKGDLSYNFGFPVVVVLVYDEPIAGGSSELKKSIKDAQHILRWNCHQFGGALVDCVCSDPVSVEKCRQYILHRLYPDDVKMELQLEVTIKCICTLS